MSEERARVLFACALCGFNTDSGHEYYFVHRELWFEHGAGKRMLCIGCLEQNLGRALVRADFTSGFLSWAEQGVVTPTLRWGFLRVSERLRSRFSASHAQNGRALENVRR